MKCLHCQLEFSQDPEYAYVGTDVDRIWLTGSSRCPACGKATIVLVNADGESVEHTPINEKMRFTIYPRTTRRQPCPMPVPGDIAQDYLEACLALDCSPRASAALSRGALQKILRGAAGVLPGELAEELLDLLDSRTLPPHLSDLVKGAVIISNFYANPEKSRAPMSIMPVAAAEADLLVEVLEALFDFYYVQPAVSAGRWASLKSRLVFEGKPLLE